MFHKCFLLVPIRIKTMFIHCNRFIFLKSFNLPSFYLKFLEETIDYVDGTPCDANMYSAPLNFL